MAASTGSSVPTNPGMRGDGEDKRLPKMRPNTTNTTTGIPTVPMRPSGSRTKILISSQVSFRSWRNIVDVFWKSRASVLGFGVRSSRCIQLRIECPVNFRNTSSSVGSTVLKAVTWMRFSDRQSITFVTRSSPDPLIVIC